MGLKDKLLNLTPEKKLTYFKPSRKSTQRPVFKPKIINDKITMVCAGNSYQIKEDLMQYGYKWRPDKKVWHKELKKQRQLLLEIRFVLRNKWCFLGDPEELVDIVDGVG